VTHAFDKDYWDRHWEHDRPQAAAAPPANPYLVREASDLGPGTALDAGCGEGAEAIWLAADITALLDRATWEIVTAEEHSRDAVVRAIRLGQRPTR
jgi:SAM-dependent methyltransferase